MKRSPKLKSCGLSRLPVGIRLSPIILFLDFAILIVICPLMSFIKGLVMVQGFRAMLLQSPPLPTGTINFIFSKKLKLSRKFHVILHVKFKILNFHEMFES